MCADARALASLSAVERYLLIVSVSSGFGQRQLHPAFASERKRLRSTRRPASTVRFCVGTHRSPLFQET